MQLLGGKSSAMQYLLRRQKEKQNSAVPSAKDFLSFWERFKSSLVTVLMGGGWFGTLPKGKSLLPNPYEPPNGPSESPIAIEPKATWRRIYFYSHLVLSVAACLSVTYETTLSNPVIRFVGDCGIVAALPLLLLGCIQCVRTAVQGRFWIACFWGVDSMLSLVTLYFIFPAIQ